MASLHARNIRKVYRGGVVALSDVSFDVEDGERAVIVGPSGCGKTTLLRLIAGLDRPTAGDVAIGDRTVTREPPARRDVAMVFQNGALYPHMTVRANLRFGLGARGLDKREIAQRVDDAADLLKIGSILGRRSRACSGGERQRAALGRAIVRRPKVLLLDEPLANLDAHLRASMRAELKALHARLGITALHVTHDQEEAMALADRLIVMREGRIEQVGDPVEVFCRPANRFVGSFVGTPAMSFLEGRIERAGTAASIVGDGGEWRMALPASFASETLADAASLGVRHGTLVVPHDSCDLVAHVETVEPLGDRTDVRLRVGSAQIALRCERREAPSPGDRRGVRFDWTNAHLFDGDGKRVSGRPT